MNAIEDAPDSPSENEHAMVSPSRSIDVARCRYPYCIVWTPLPVITWFLPIIGHMGIANSRGIIYDFAGPYHIGEDNMAFGKPTRYLPLDPGRCKREQWDEAVAHASDTYRKRMHNICCDNCHSHVALALRKMLYAGSESWNMIILCCWILFAGRFVSYWGVIQQWAPLCVIVVIIVAVA